MEYFALLKYLKFRLLLFQQNQVVVLLVSFLQYFSITSKVLRFDDISALIYGSIVPVVGVEELRD